MPIHFRCTACERMLSIARRKAGQEVSCPKCGIYVRVPAAAGVALASNPLAPPKNQPLFERADFEELLDPAVKAAAKDAPTPNALRETPPTRAALVTSVDESGEMEVVEVDGVVISRSRMTILAVVIAILLALSFALGYFIALATKR